jgi:hypothetical protein
MYEDRSGYISLTHRSASESEDIPHVDEGAREEGEDLAGLKAKDKLKGFWDHFWVFMEGDRTYTDDFGKQWAVDADGVIIGPALITGMPPEFLGGPFK